MASHAPLPWLDKSTEGHGLTVLVNGPEVVVYSRNGSIVDLVHVREGRTRSLVLVSDEELAEELDAIARGDRRPPG